MSKPRFLLVAAGSLSFNLSLFQAGVSFSPRWSAAFGAPPELVSDPPRLLASGLLTSVVWMIFGLYGLSGAGVVRRLPLVRLGLLGIGSGYLLMGTSFIPQALVLAHVLPATQPILLHLVITSFVLLVMALLYLAGLAARWRSLSAGAPGIMRGQSSPREHLTQRAQSETGPNQ